MRFSSFNPDVKDFPLARIAIWLNCLLNGGAEGAKSTTEARRYVKVEARDRESGGED